MPPTNSEAVALEYFLRRAKAENTLQQLYVYRTKSSEQDAINIVLGEYSSLSEARQALAELPSSLKRYQPYLRNIKSILAEAGVTEGEA